MKSIFEELFYGRIRSHCLYLQINSVDGRHLTPDTSNGVIPQASKDDTTL